MAELNIRKQFYNEQGELESLKIYTTQTEVGTPYKKLTLNIDGENITGYIGLTDELDTPKISSNKVIIDGKEYRERKYVGIKNMSNWARNTYNSEELETIEDIIDFPDTSDSTNFDTVLYGMRGLRKHPKMDTRNATSLNYAYGGTINLEEYPDLNTKKCTNFSSMYHGSNIRKSPNIDTSNGTNLNSMFRVANNLIKVDTINTEKANTLEMFIYNSPLIEVVDNLNTKLCTSFSHFATADRHLRYCCPLDLSSITYEAIINNGKLKNAFMSCVSLQSITLNNVPLNITEEDIRSTTSAPSTCEIIINYREIKERTPIRIIKAENMKLVDIDVNGDMPIIREGNKPLDEYIVNSGDWGTIYDDGDKFRCFVTKDNLIYTGNAYNSATRIEIQPEVPDGVEVPSTSIRLEKTNKQTFENNSFIFTDIILGTASENRLFPQGWNSYYLQAYSTEQYEKHDICFSYLNYISPVTSQRNCMKFNYFLIPGSSQFARPVTTKSIYIYDGQLFTEELENELSKIKTKVLSVTRDETNPNPALEFSIKEGVL